MDSIPSVLINIIYDFFLDLYLLEHGDKFVKVMDELNDLNEFNYSGLYIGQEVNITTTSCDVTQFEIPHSRKSTRYENNRKQFRNKRHRRQYMKNLHFFDVK